MAYEVLARKWRPKQFDDVVGQDHVTRTLRNAIARDLVAHAYLFVGPRGVGKTTLARIFAKALNCETGLTQTPCDACDACGEIARGISLDVLEIDGASNNGVEQVRDLRETVQFAPARGRFKIVIIDEVHMLSTSAFNALLKTLEEPPPHVKFIFATTEADKVLPTIVSRCQRFDLRRIPAPLIVERLRHIAGVERVEIDEDALLAIARGAEGGMRDAQSAMDQLIAFTGERISEADVLAIFGLVSRQTLEELALHILRGESPEMLGIVHRLEASGKDLRRLTIELLDHFRNVLLASLTNGDAALLDVTETQLKVLREHAALSDARRLIRITEVLIEVDGRMRFALSRRIVLETALIRCAQQVAAVSLEDVLRRLNEIKSSFSNGKGEPALSSSATPRSTAAPGGAAGGPAADKPPPSAILEDPAVREAISIFKGKVVDVRT